MSDTRPVLVSGATGFVGGHLAHHLAAEGTPVRCGSRRPERARAEAPQHEWVRFDLDDPDTLRAALEGSRAYVHLVHHMADDPHDLVAREVETAERVASLAAEAGVERLVYLGAPASADTASAHLVARARTGEALRAGTVPCFELRASMIIGAGSESWLIVRDLAMRLPVMVLPAWLRSRTQPIALADVIGALACALRLDIRHAGCWDLPGPDTMSAREVLSRVAAVANLDPLMMPVPILTPTVSSLWIRAFTRADGAIARRLVKGLTHDLLADSDAFWDLCPDLQRTPFDQAVLQALADEDPTQGIAGWWERRVRRAQGLPSP